MIDNPEPIDEQISSKYLQLQSILEASRDGMWDMNVITGETYYSPRCAEMLGYKPEEIESTIESWKNLIHPDDFANTTQQLDDYLAGKTTTEYMGEYRLLHASGKWRWMLSRGKVTMVDEQGKPLRMAGLITDITELKQTEERLRMVEFSLNHGADGVHWLDQTGLQIYVNDRLCENLGYSREELLTMSVPDIDPNFPIDAFRAIWDAIKQKGSETFETLHRRKDGSLMHVEVKANYMQFNEQEYICSSIRDITERKELEQQLELVKFSLDHIGDSIHWITEDGSMVYVNHAASKNSGYTADELLRMRIYDLDTNFTPQLMVPLWKHLREQETLMFEATHRHKSGYDVPVEVLSNYISFHGKEYACTISRDISERKKAEAEQEALQERIIAAQREALRELSSPLLPIARGVLVMPLIGTIDSLRAQQVMEILLEGVASHQAHIAILDITGVQVVDTQVANALLQSAQAVRLLGAQVVLTGIGVAMAQTLVHLGADLSSIVTLGSLESGIAYAMRKQPKS